MHEHMLLIMPARMLVLDGSGSMSDENASVRTYADDFARILGQRNIDWRLGVVSSNCQDIVNDQAVDPFMQLTPTELHDWFHEPILEPAVHRRFLDLSGPEPAFVSKLEANMGEAAPFPGGSYYALQILAFWLSLLRYFCAWPAK